MTIDEEYKADAFRKLKRLHRRHRHAFPGVATGRALGGWHRSFYERAVRFDLRSEPYAEMVAGVALMYFGVPYAAYINAGASAANTLANGGSITQAVWAGVGSYVGSSIAGGVVGGDSFVSAVGRGALAGGINGGVSASLSGGSFSVGFRTGAYSGAAFAGGTWAWQNRAAIGQTLGNVAGSVRNGFSRLSDSLSGRSILSGQVVFGPLEALEFENSRGVYYAWGTSASDAEGVFPSPDPTAYLEAAQRLDSAIWWSNYGHLMNAGGPTAWEAVTGGFGGGLGRALRTGYYIGNIVPYAAVAPIVVAEIGGSVSATRTTAYFLRFLLEVWTSNDSRFPTTPIEPPPEIEPYHPPTVPTGPANPPGP